MNKPRMLSTLLSMLWSWIIYYCCRRSHDVECQVSFPCDCVLAERERLAAERERLVSTKESTKEGRLDRRRTKKRIPAAIKRLVWNMYIGETVGKSKCMCCNWTDITQSSFHCGHVIAESRGGQITVDNLRPICQNCNSSMGSENMMEFIQRYRIRNHVPGDSGHGLGSKVIQKVFP